MSTRRNAAWNISYRVFSILLPLVTAPYLSRTVGQAGVGVYSYAWSISEIFVIIAMLGLSDYGVRAIAKVRDNRDRLNETFSGIYRMQLAVAGVTLLVWLGYVFFVSGTEKTIAFHLTMMSVSCLVNLDWCLMGMDCFKPIALRNIAVKSIAAVCVFIFVHSVDDLWIYGFAWSLATLIGCLLCWPALQSRVSFVKVPFSEWKKHFRPCTLLLVSVLAVRVYRTMDKIMVGAISGMAENGLYENAEKIIYCLSGFISAIGSVLMPKVSHMVQQGEHERVLKHIELSMHVILCMTTAMAFGVAAIANEFTPLFYGEDFSRSAILMMPLAFTLILIGFANVIRTQWILPHESDKIILKCVSAGAIVNLILNSCLIPFMGAVGAVIATLFAEFTVPFMQYIQLRKQLPYHRYMCITLGYIICGALMLAAVLLIKIVTPAGWFGLVLDILTGIVVYTVVCLIYWKVTANHEILKLLKIDAVMRRLKKK